MEPITVIDLGTTKVVCLAATQNESGELRVEAVSQVGANFLRKGVVADVDSAASAIDEAVSRVERALGRSIEGLAVTVSGAHLQSVNAQGFIPIYPNTRQIRRDDVLAVINHSRQIVMPTDREQIMAIPREFRVDGQRGITRPIGMTGGRLEVVTHVITGQTASINAIDKAVTRAGRRVTEMVALPLASGLGVTTPDDIESGCAVIDIGAGQTNIAIFRGGAITHTASIPIGGHHVTTDLSALLRVSPDEAERLKTQNGAALSRAAAENETVQVKQLDQNELRPMQRRVLCEIIESRMREIVSLVRKQIESSGQYDDLVSGVFVTGGGSMLPAVGTLFGEALEGSKIQMAFPRVTGQFARTVEVPTMSTAVGLAQYCLESDELEFAPVSGFSNWKEKIRTLRNPFTKKG